jgi:ubiquinone/menaquinone biosynthesis C-methylase UbiE
VGGTGAVITFGVTWLLTEKFGLWYMGSLVIATAIAMTSNFLFNNYWTFAVKPRTPSDADYEWFAYYKGNPIQRWWKRSIAKIVWEWIPNSSKLLEVGCGSSPLIGRYKRAIGIDKNEDKIKFMREKFPDNNFIPMDTTEGFKSSSFDYVLCIEVIEHLSAPEKMVTEISRVLKTGGIAVIATPDYSRILWHIAERFTPYKEEHCAKFTRGILEEMCRKHNLIPVQHRYVAKCDLIEQFIKR